jgi:site-specific recombinase XerD
MTKKKRQPVPLFDGLRHLETQKLMEGYPKPFAPSDFDAIKSFLLQYARSQDTFNTYRRECERLAQWAWHVANKSILTLQRNDIESYLAFCQKPPASWVGTKKVARYKWQDGIRCPNPDWRMFVVTLKKSDIQNGSIPLSMHYQFSKKALQSLFACLNSLFRFLISENLTEINPISQIKQKNQIIRQQSQQRVVRRLSCLQWESVMDAATGMADENPERHERTLFVVSALYLMYLRISELASHARWQPTMGHFFQDSQENWWFKTVGKGNKERDITVSDSMLLALKRYRKHRGLSPALPLPGELEPLLHHLRGKGTLTSSRHVRLLVQACFDQAVANLKKDQLHEDAVSLQEATVHWLRHTGISDDINKRGRPITHVRDDAGHASSATTDLYNDAEQQARHRSGKKKNILPSE